MTFPLGGCLPCKPGTPRIPSVHNVRLEDFEHSDFLNEVHARDLWLATLWHMEPWEYIECTGLCSEAAGHWGDNREAETGSVEETLGQCIWSWMNPEAGEENLRNYISKRVSQKLVAKGNNVTKVELDGITGRTLRRAWNIINAAWAKDASQNGNCRYAYPPYAIAEAIRQELI